MREIKFRVWNTREKKMHMPFKGCSTTYNLNYYENTKHTAPPMQYTGQEDKKGVEIYEGDILIEENREPLTVVWSKPLAKFILTAKSVCVNFTALGEYNVIGNIYENEGLLNG